jgi:hypothetical protein
MIKTDESIKFKLKETIFNTVRVHWACCDKIRAGYKDFDTKDEAMLFVETLKRYGI